MKLSKRKVIGLVLILAPITAVSVLTGLTSGWKAVAAIYGLIFSIAGFVVTILFGIDMFINSE